MRLTVFSHQIIANCINSGFKKGVKLLKFRIFSNADVTNKFAKF